jgi:hypothetical protein
MSTLTKDQFQKLTAEQQEVLASTVISAIRRRQQLMKLAPQRWTYRIPTTLFFAAVVGFAIFQAGKTPIMSSCIVLLTLLVQIHATVLHRRLDALLNLVDAELQSRSENRSDNEEVKRNMG